MTVSSGGLHRDLSIHCDSVVKSEHVPSVSSLTSQPVAELVVCTVNDEMLSYMEKKFAVGAEQFAVPVTLTFAVAGQHPSSDSDGTLGLSSSVVPSLVVSTTKSTNISPSLFCPAIVDVRSLKTEPEDDDFVSTPSSAVLEKHHALSSSSNSKSDLVEKPTATAVHCDDVPFHPSNISSCPISVCSSSLSLISNSAVSLCPLTSFPGLFPAKMTVTTGADLHVLQSTASEVIKQEFSPATHSCSSSVKHSSSTALPPDGTGNSTEIRVSRRTNFTDRTDQCSVSTAEGVDVNVPVTSAKTVKTIDGASAPDKTVLHIDSRKCIYSKTASIDSSVTGKHVPPAAKRKCDAESGDCNMPQSRNECETSVTPNVRSSKRKCETTTKTGMCAYFC